MEIAEVKTQEFNHYIEVQGKVDGEDNIYVAPKMSGIVTAVFAKEGEVVWQCRNCGYIHVGKEAPQACPACLHPQAYFEVKKENM